MILIQLKAATRARHHLTSACSTHSHTLPLPAHLPLPSRNNSDHSLGVGHLAQKWASHIYSFQGNEVSMDHMDITCVTLAGSHWDTAASAMCRLIFLIQLILP